jgi:hypothetical protein
LPPYSTGSTCSKNGRGRGGEFEASGGEGLGQSGGPRVWGEWVPWWGLRRSCEKRDPAAPASPRRAATGGSCFMAAGGTSPRHGWPTGPGGLAALANLQHRPFTYKHCQSMHHPNSKLRPDGQVIAGRRGRGRRAGAHVLGHRRLQLCQVRRIYDLDLVARHLSGWQCDVTG